MDLAVIILFTHPMMVWILRFRFFGQGHRLSGLDPEHLGARSMAAYGRGRQAVTERLTGVAGTASQSLARRKAAARAGSSGSGGTTLPPGSARQAGAPAAGSAPAHSTAADKDGEDK